MLPIGILPIMLPIPDMSRDARVSMPYSRKYAVRKHRESAYMFPDSVAILPGKEIGPLVSTSDSWYYA